MFKVQMAEGMSMEQKVPLNEEYEVTNPMTGEKIKTISRMEGNKLISKPVKETPKSISSCDEVIHGKFVVTMTTPGGLLWKQYFVKV